MFIIGDIIARFSRMKGKKIFFPIGLHFSGNTAEHVAKAFVDIFSKNNISEKNKKILNLYKNIYKVPKTVLRSFTSPLNILNFYTQEVLWELKSLDVSGDFRYFYTTKDKDFSIFVNTIISLYQKNKVLIINKNRELALDYDNVAWRKQVIDLLNRTEFVQPFHKNNIISAMKAVRSDWGMLRKNGFGVIYQKRGIVDPMFDSELLSVFDLYIRFKKEYPDKLNNVKVKNIFINLFNVLKKQESPQNSLVDKIIQWLPCDIFICEEHLKNWVVKKLFAESLLLDKDYQTKKYFVLGMGLLNGKRMSASRGNAILAKDLINYYGPLKARLIIILQGGHPSKTYSYDQSVLAQIDKMLEAFNNYYIYLFSLANKEVNIKKINEENLPIKMICDTIEQNLSKGYYRQAIIELLSILPQKYKVKTTKTARRLISIYKKYLGILLPGLLKTLPLIPDEQLLNYEKIY
jgi:leucyl-tRNA synthetase